MGADDASKAGWLKHAFVVGILVGLTVGDTVLIAVLMW
jgi:hypothetical protein